MKRFMSRFGPTMWLAAIIPFTATAQTIALSDYLPYPSGGLSTLHSDSGFVMNVADTSATTFQWDAADGVQEGLRQTFRLDSAGLAFLMEQGVLPGGAIVYTETYDPPWLLSPAQLEIGQQVTSSSSYTGFEFGETWSGTSEGSLTVAGFENVETPAGPFEALKIVFEGSWMQVGEDFLIEATTMQTWWMALERGLVSFAYSYTSTYTEDSESETESGGFNFELVSSTFLELPFISASPVSQSAVVAGSSATFTAEASGPGTLRYQWFRGTTAIEGATTANLTISDLSEDDEGFYSVVISNFNGSVTSATAELTVEPASPSITIVDTNLEAAIRETLGKPEGGLTTADMAALTTLVAIDLDIADVSGLEHAVNLNSLNLRGNRISDLAPIAELPSLNLLRLARNDISDVTLLAGLSTLTILELSTNQISDVASLAGLTNLIGLDLQSNLITDITPIAALGNLNSALLGWNFLDISPSSTTSTVINNWLAGGTNVLFTPQNEPPDITATISISTTPDGFLLRWESLVGVTYRVRMSTDLANWADLPRETHEGTGSQISHPISRDPENDTVFFQVVSIN